MLTARLRHNGNVKSLKTKWLTSFAMVLVALASCVAFVAAGDLGGASADGLRATEVALGQAAELADATASLAVGLQQSVKIVATGMGSAAEAMDHTIEVSKNVRRLLDSVSLFGVPVFTKVDDLSNSLQDAEASLLEVQGGMSETQVNLTAAGPSLDKAVANLSAVPGELRAAQATISETTARLDRQVLLWRLVIVVGGLAFVLLLAILERLVRARSAVVLISRSTGQP